MLSTYFQRRGLQPPSGATWAFFLALSWYRKAAISHGVYARSLQGNASSTTADQHGLGFCAMVEICLATLDKFPSAPSAKL